MLETNRKSKTEVEGKCFWKPEPDGAAKPSILPESGIKVPSSKTRKRPDYYQAQDFDPSSHLEQTYRGI